MDDPSGAPINPDLKIFDVNGKGVLYSMHLTMHYCQREGIGGVRGDKSLVIATSLAGIWISLGDCNMIFRNALGGSDESFETRSLGEWGEGELSCSSVSHSGQ
jgi:hypothetical protein